MIVELGFSALILLPPVALYSLGMTWLGARYRDARAFRSGLLATYGVALLSWVVAGAAAARFVEVPGTFLGVLSAAWSGIDGVLLGWLAVLSGLGVVAARQLERAHPRHLPVVNAVLMLLVVGFAVTLLWGATPFASSVAAWADGAGRSAVWQAPQLVVHRLALWLGCGSAALAGALVISGWCGVEMDAGWLALVRRWTFGCWWWLGVALLCRMHWSYYRFGGGGFWNGEPLEQVVLMPWLAATAVLHGLRVQERRGMWRDWNGYVVGAMAWFALFAVLLSSLGHGPSVDAAALARVAPYFAGVLLVALGGVGVVAVARVRTSGASAGFESFYSKEGTLLLNNGLLLVGVAVLAAGTVWPTVRSWLTGTEELVGTMWQDTALLWIGLGIIGMAGVGPVCTWRRATHGMVWRALRWPLLAGLLAGGAAWAAGARGGLLLSACVVGTTTGIVTVVELLRGVRLWRRAPILVHAGGAPVGPGIFHRAPRRYGGYVVHLGMLAVFAAVVGAQYAHTVQVQLQPGEQAVVGPYTVEFSGLRLPESGAGGAVAAELVVRRGVQVATTLRLTARGSAADVAAWPGPAIYSRLSHDLSALLLHWNSRGGAARFQLELHPLIGGMWMGAALFLAGTLVMMWPRRAVRVAAPAERVA